MAKTNDTDPMNAPLTVQRTTQPMLTVPPPPAPSSSDDLTATTETPLTDLVANMSEKDCSPSLASKPALSKDEIRSMFQDLSDGLGDPTRRAAAPDSEIAQYARPHPLRSRNKTPVLEPAIVVRNSVLEGALASSSRNIAPSPSPDTRRDGPAKAKRPIRLGTATVQTRPFSKTTRGRVGAILLGAISVLAITGALLFLPTQGPAPASARSETTTVTEVKANAPTLATLATTDAASVAPPAPTAAAAAVEPPNARPEPAARTTSPTPSAPATTLRPRTRPVQAPSPTTSDPPAPSSALPYPFFNQERK